MTAGGIEGRHDRSPLRRQPPATGAQSLHKGGRGHRVGSLAKRTDELGPFVDARRFRLDEVRAETVRLRSIVRTAPVAGVGLLGAFRLALKLEDGLIESQVFTVCEGDSPELAAVLSSLAEATEGHRAHLSEPLSGKSG